MRLHIRTRQGDWSHVQEGPLERLYQLPRGWPGLPDEQAADGALRGLALARRSVSLLEVERREAARFAQVSVCRLSKVSASKSEDWNVSWSVVVGSKSPEPEFLSATLHLHIGLPKTASTWMQEALCPQISGIDYYPTPRSGIFKSEQDRAADQRVFACALPRSSTVWDGLSETILDEVWGAGKGEKRQDTLISEEGIGRQGSRGALLSAHLKCIFQLAQNYGFERTNIICVVRRQDHWLASHYAQVSDRKPRASQSDFEDGIASTIDPAFPK